MATLLAVVCFCNKISHLYKIDKKHIINFQIGVVVFIVAILLPDWAIIDFVNTDFEQ